MKDDVYTLENERLTVAVPTSTFSLTVTDRASGRRWEMVDETFDEVVLERDGVVSKHTLAGSQAMVARQLGPGALLVEFSDYRLQLRLVLEDHRLHVEVIPLQENQAFKIKGVVYPRAFKVTKSSHASFVVAHQQGVMIPGDWPTECSLGGIWDFDDEKRYRIHGELFDMDVDWWSSLRPGYAPTLLNRMLMPWWGIVEKEASMMVVLDEASWPDSYLWVMHPPGGPPTWRLLWQPSWGQLRFPRRVTHHFFEGGDYRSLCTAYRAIAEERGKCVTLKEKAEQKPAIERLRGATNATIVFLSRSHKALTHEVRKTFAEAADLVEEFSRQTDLRLHLACRGWQQRGHDHQYPDLVPPAPDCGGPVEFDRMATRIQELGHVFGISGDNYHDVSLESPLFDESMLLRFVDGSTNRRNFWASGLTSMVCAGAAMKYLRRNFEVGRTDYPPTKGLLETAHPDTYWIGNYINTYECYDHRHPMTRTTYWEAQRRIFEYINDCGLVLNNEHPMDWAAPYFYMARTRQARGRVYGYDRSGDTVGIPVPLWSLVYHDCLITGGDNALLQMMNGSPGRIDLDNVDDDALDRARIHSRLHASVCFEPMVDHAFLSDDHKRQQSTFANGARVTVDEGTNEVLIEGVDGVEEKAFAIDSPGKNYY